MPHQRARSQGEQHRRVPPERVGCLLGDRLLKLSQLLAHFAPTPLVVPFESSVRGLFGDGHGTSQSRVCVLLPGDH